MKLFDAFGRPVSTGGNFGKASLEAGSYRGTIANWRPASVKNVQDESRERDITQKRAADLYANDWAARSGLRVIADNVVGQGLLPK